MAKRLTHEILKAFAGGGKRHSPGDRVDASSWRNTRQLVNSRYMIPIGEASTNSLTQEVIP